MCKYNDNDIIMIEQDDGSLKPLICEIKYNGSEKVLLFPVLKPGTIMKVTSNCKRHNPDYGIINKKEKHAIDCMDTVVLAPNPYEAMRNPNLTQEFCRIYFIYGDEIDNEYNYVDS